MKEAMKKTGRSVWVMFWLFLGATWPFLILVGFLTATSSGKLELGDKYSLYFMTLLGFSALYLFAFTIILRSVPIITKTTLFSTIISAILVYLVGSLFDFYPHFW
jgi:hypothetical protein